MSPYFHAIWRRRGLAVTMGMLACGLSVAPWALARPEDGTDKKEPRENAMQEVLFRWPFDRTEYEQLKTAVLEDAKKRTNSARQG